MANAIELINVSKRFDNQDILKTITLTIPEGQTIGIKGVNGSGKSLLLRTIVGLVQPTTGTVMVFNQRIPEDSEFAPDIGALIDQAGFLDRYSGRQNLQLLARIRNHIDDDQIDETLHLVGLDPHNGQPVREYSTGMRQRLGIAQAIMENPRLVILDEPTNGIDVHGLDKIFEIIEQLQSRGATILLTSHHHQYLKQFSDALYTMQNGQLYSTEAEELSFGA